MNNKMLNREFQNKMLVEKKHFNAKSGFTDSEDEDETSTKSSSRLSPGRSQALSARSSLLSGRSPRDDNKLNMQWNRNQSNQQRRRSPESEEERSNTLSSPRKLQNSRFQLDNLSPKSPRVDPRMNSDRSDHAGPLPRFDTSQRQRQTNLMRQSTDEDRLTPRSSRSASERDDFSSGMNMLSTMRHPMNEKAMKRGDSFEKAQQQNRTGTPTRLSATAHSPQQQQRRGRYDQEDIIDEEQSSRSRSGSAVGRSSEQLWNNRSSNFTKDQGSLSPKNPRRFEERLPEARQRSPVNEREQVDLRFNDHDSFGVARRTSPLEQDRMREQDNVTEASEEKKREDGEEAMKPMVRKPSTSSVRSEKVGERDPEVEETLEDSRTTMKLQQQREEKRLERERRAKNQTEATRNIEAAIEAVENTMEDSVRLGQLKEKESQLNYRTKPKLDETKVLLTDKDSSQRRTLQRSLSARGPRSSRSSSMSRTHVDKYAHIKPKTMTRVSVQTARTDADNSKLNTTGILNDSGAIRENVYNEWYLNKMSAAQQGLKNAQLRQRDDEEAKAQELIRKLEKSDLEYKKWMMAKEKVLKDKQTKDAANKKALADKLESKRTQKMAASKAFEQWVLIKAEKMREAKQEARDDQKTNAKDQRNATKKKAAVNKPPLPFDAWNKKKEEQINEKLNSEKEKARQKRLKEKEKEERKKLAEICYLEWLDKKDDDEEKKSTNLNRSMSNSMSAMPPFYPNSRTIPFGR